MRVPGSQWQCWAPSVHREVPDGGWGWAVAAAFFGVEVCTYGTIKSLGVFLQDLMDEFGESTSRVSWVVSICVFVFTFTAPLATVLSGRLGHRPVVMLGGLLISLGTCSSAFTSSINHMYVTIGIVSGLGHCLAFIPTVSLLAQYWSRRRALVTAAASTGECVAIFAFAPALTALKAHIGWRYCLLVLGAVQASVIGCGLLLRPIVIQPDLGAEEPDLGGSGERVSLKRLEAAGAVACELEAGLTRSSLSSGASRGSQDSGVTSLSASNLELRTGAVQEEEEQGEEPPAGPSPPSSATEELPACEKRREAESGAGPEPPRAPPLLDLRALREPPFLCYCCFGLLATLGFFAPQLYVVELSRGRGVAPPAAAALLAAMAAAELLGRLAVGPLLARARRRKTRVLLGCAALLSAALLAFPAARSLWSLALCSATYGFLLGTVASTHIPLLAEDEVVGAARMASCLGVYVSIQSFAGLAGPPLAGWLVDVTHSYDAAFYLCAAGMGAGALCLAMVAVPPQPGLCWRRGAGGAAGAGEAQDSEQQDFLEVDYVPDCSPARHQQEAVAGGGAEAKVRGGASVV